MNSITFPDMFNKTTTNVTSGYYATLQNIETLLLTNKGEFESDPYFGCDLRKFIYDQKDVILKDVIIDDIYSAIKLFIPQVIVKRSDITLDIDEKSTVKVQIKALDRASFKTDMYNIVVMQ